MQHASSLLQSTGTFCSKVQVQVQVLVPVTGGGTLPVQCVHAHHHHRHRDRLSPRDAACARAPPRFYYKYKYLYRRIFRVLPADARNYNRALGGACNVRTQRGGVILEEESAKRLKILI
jgi:hypothetical protein